MWTPALQHLRYILSFLFARDLMPDALILLSRDMTDIQTTSIRVSVRLEAWRRQVTRSCVVSPSHQLIALRHILVPDTITCQTSNVNKATGRPTQSGLNFEGSTMQRGQADRRDRSLVVTRPETGYSTGDVHVWPSGGFLCAVGGGGGTGEDQPHVIAFGALKVKPHQTSKQAKQEKSRVPPSLHFHGPPTISSAKQITCYVLHHRLHPDSLNTTSTPPLLLLFVKHSQAPPQPSYKVPASTHLLDLQQLPLSIPVTPSPSHHPNPSNHVGPVCGSFHREALHWLCHIELGQCKERCNQQ